MRETTAERIKRWSAVAGEFAFGLAISAGGVLLGWFMWHHPEGSPTHSFAAPVLVGTLVAFFGVVIMSSALGAQRLFVVSACVVFWMFVLCGNYFVFTATDASVACSGNASFLGTAVFSSAYGGAECRMTGYVLMLGFDAVLLGGMVWAWWKTRRKRN